MLFGQTLRENRGLVKTGWEKTRNVTARKFFFQIFLNQPRDFIAKICVFCEEKRKQNKSDDIIMQIEEWKVLFYKKKNWR